MLDKFTVEIITPEKSLLSLETNEVTIPSYEGEIGILKDHIPLITFLRPGIISIQDQKNQKYYVEEGTVEFLKNNLLILTSTVKDLTNLSQDSIENLLKQEENKLMKNNFSDKEKYLISHKISTLKEISQ